MKGCMIFKECILSQHKSMMWVKMFTKLVYLKDISDFRCKLQDISKMSKKPRGGVSSRHYHFKVMLLSIWNCYKVFSIQLFFVLLQNIFIIFHFITVLNFKIVSLWAIFGLLLYTVLWNKYYPFLTFPMYHLLLPFW